MSLLNSVLRMLFDVLLYPFGGLPPIVGVALVSLLTAVGMLLVFREASDQKGLAAVKRRIHACIFEIRLFNDDLRAILRAQGEILRHNLTYLRLSMVPMLWMIVPIVLLIAQLQFHYGYRGLAPGEKALVTVVLKAPDEAGEFGGNGGGKPLADLEVPAGLRVETPAMWIPSLRELSWRISGDHPGEYEVRVDLGGEAYTKSILVSDGLARRSPIRLEPGFLNQVLYPAEDPLPDACPIRSIAVGYPEADVNVFGFRLHWLIVYFVLSVVLAFSLKGLFGVTI